MKGQLALVICWLTPIFIHAANIDEMSGKVIELRRETEELNTQYELRKQQIVEELKTLSTQKMEMAAGISEEELKAKQLQAKIIELKKTLQSKSVVGDELEASNEDILVKLKSYIENSLPYQKSQRLVSVDQLADKIKNKEIAPAQAANLLWSLIADEKRLAKETTLSKQNIDIDGKEVLAEVLKVGMVTMYFITDQGAVGQVVKDANQWQYKVISDAKQSQNVVELMDSYKKQIRNGYFELPMLQAGRN